VSYEREKDVFFVKLTATNLRTVVVFLRSCNTRDYICDITKLDSSRTSHCTCGVDRAECDYKYYVYRQSHISKLEPWKRT